MADKLARYTLRVHREILDKLQYIAKYEDRSKNKVIERLIQKHIREFEESNGVITDPLMKNEKS